MSVPALRVLVAEDSSVVRTQLETLLTGVGGIDLVAILEDGNAAVDAIATLQPDVALLEVRMPGRNGLEVLCAVRDVFSGTVVILTNFADPLTKRLCLEAGADFFFDKSTEFREMLRVVRALRDKRAGT
jgi:DNA-binding NarL/FixJ family response regulator